MNNFREWLSDNLRYIMLIFGILVVLVGLFFGVRAVSARISAGKNDSEMSLDSVVEAVPADKAASAAGAAVSGAEEVMVPDALSGTESAVSVEEPAENALVKEAPDSAAAVLMTSYYEAVGNQDIAAVRELVDILPETKAAEISSERLTYSDVEVYTKPGLTTGSYVVYTTYSYSGQDSDSSLPGISQSYVTTDENGDEKIVFSGLDSETQEYIDAVAKDADVTALISSVRDEYNEARSGREAAAGTTQSLQTASSSEGGEDTSADASDEEEDASETSYDSSDDEDYDEDYDSGEDYDEEEDGGEDYSEDEEDYDEPEEEESSEWTGSAISEVNVRSGPGFDYGVIGELSEGQEVTVTGEENGWYHVYADGLEGYVGHSWID